MKKIRILAIVPYEGLREQVLLSARKRDDVSVNVFIGELAEGAKLAKAEEAAYDVILSRGGTAETIAKTANLPVVWIQPTVFDMLRVFRLVQAYAGKYAIVGFPDITHNAEVLFEVIQIKGDVYTITRPEQVEECILALKRQDYTMIIGDVIAVSTAKRLHMNGILITSGEESVETALNEAVRICRQAQKEDVSMRLLRDMLSMMDEKVCVFGMEREVVYSTLQKEPELPPSVKRLMFASASRVLAGEKVEIKKAVNGMLYRLLGERLQYNEQTVAMYRIRVLSDASPSTSGMLNYYIETDEEREPLIDNIGRMNEIFATARRLAPSSTPVLLLREKGIDELHIARSIHTHSALRDTPMLIVDMSFSNKKNLKYLLQNENSPLNENNQFILIRNIGLLTEDAGGEFRYYAETTNFHRRNRVIYALAPDDDAQWQTYLLERNCIKLSVPPLRERPEDIMSLATLCLNTYSYQSGLRVIGFDDEAASLLVTFPWAQNVAQMQRVVHRAVLTCAGLCVGGEDVRAALREEEQAYPLSYDKAICEGTLAEITERVARIVLEQENGNRTNASTRLGISRSTLWRLLNASAPSQSSGI